MAAVVPSAPRHLTLRERVGALFASRDDSSIELVMTANAFTGVAIGAAAWLMIDVPFAWAVGMVPAVFLLLTAGLLYRRTVWLSAAAGAVVMAVSPALLLGLLAAGVHPLGTWLGGGVGFLIGFGVTAWTYGKVSKIARGVFDRPAR